MSSRTVAAGNARSGDGSARSTAGMRTAQRRRVSPAAPGVGFAGPNASSRGASVNTQPSVAYMPVDIFTGTAAAGDITARISGMQGISLINGGRPAIRLSRRLIARDIMATLGLSAHSEGIIRKPGGWLIAWMNIRLPQRENPTETVMRKIEGQAYGRKIDAEESLGQKIIETIKLLAGYDIDDMNYVFAKTTRQQVRQLAGWSGHLYSREAALQAANASATSSVNQLVQRIAHMCAEYGDVLPILVGNAEPGVQKIEPSCVTYAGSMPPASRLEHFAKAFISLMFSYTSDVEDLE